MNATSWEKGEFRLDGFVKRSNVGDEEWRGKWNVIYKPQQSEGRSRIRERK